MGKAKEWIFKNKGTVATLLLIATLGIALSIGVVIQKRDVERRGWEMVAGGQVLAFQGQNGDAHRVLNDVKTRYGNSRIGDYGLLFEATLFAREGNWIKALENYEEVLKRQKVKPVLPLATLGIGRCYEAMNEFDKAQVQYDEFVAQYADHFALPQAYEGLARVAEIQGDRVKAKEYLERLRVLYPDTAWAQHSEARLRQIASAPPIQDK